MKVPHSWKLIYIKGRCFTPPRSLYLSFPLLYLHFYPISQTILPWLASSPLHFPHSHFDFLHSAYSQSDSYIPTLIPQIPLIPTLISHIATPNSYVFFIPAPIPLHILLIPFPDSPFSLSPVVTFCYWHNIIFGSQKSEFINWIVNASIVKL